jgi:predicted ATPase
VRRFILTGAPGAGKTAILRQLELEGFSVVEEAATDVIAAAQARGVDQPWLRSSFLDEVAKLQRDRQLGCRAANPGRGPAFSRPQFHDRSAVCTAALAVYLDQPVTPFLAEELERLRRESIFERQVFFIRNLGFITATEARRITFEETLRFEKIHEEVYRDFAFELVYVGPGSVEERTAFIRSAICRT